ncbi:MAG: glycosyltransferase family 4 protein [Candidatus Heimdallarchaeota archaeon]
MHICYVIWKFKSPKNFQQMGGAENQLLKVIDKLKDRADIKVTIVAKQMSGDPIEEVVSPRIKIKRIKSANIPLISIVIFSVLLFFKLIRLNKKEKIDIIHLPLPDLYLRSLYLLRRILKVPIITRIAADELYPFSSYGFWLVERIYIRKLILKSDGLQTLNDQAFEYAKSIGFSKQKLFLIPNGIERANEMKKYGKLTKRIVYIGAMRHYPEKFTIEQKNLEFLILAFHELLKTKNDLQLILVGDGNYRSTLERLVTKLALNNSIIFTGYQTNIDQYLLDADIFVNPSHYEGMPNAVLEAMSKGLLVLCSRIPEHKFIIDDNVTGLLFNHKSKKDFVTKILNFYKNPNKHFQIAQKGYSYVAKKHSIDDMVGLLLDMYQSVSQNSMKRE